LRLISGYASITARLSRSSFYKRRQQYNKWFGLKGGLNFTASCPLPANKCPCTLKMAVVKKQIFHLDNKVGLGFYLIPCIPRWHKEVSLSTAKSTEQCVWRNLNHNEVICNSSLLSKYVSNTYRDITMHYCTVSQKMDRYD